MIHFIFPSDPFNKRVVDPEYEDDLNALTARAFNHSLFSFEDFMDGKFKPIPTIPEGVSVVYRGWMMTPDTYSMLNDALVTSGASLVTSPTQYRLCHHLPEWYNLCAEFTPQTIITERAANFATVLHGNTWARFFVKDYVKSLSNTHGSFASTPEQVHEIVNLMEQYRGSVEGGVCIREVEQFISETEERYFVFNKQVHGRDGQAIPDMVNTIASRINSPFFSIDVIEDVNHNLRLIELGDGQVSSIKKWKADDFASIFV